MHTKRKNPKIQYTPLNIEYKKLSKYKKTPNLPKTKQNQILQ